MLNVIYDQTNFESKQIQILGVKQLPNLSFGIRRNTQNADSFEIQNSQENKKKNKLNLLMVGLTSASITLVGMTRYKSGLILKELGEKAPFFTIERLVKIKDKSIKDELTGLFNRKALDVSISRDYMGSLKKGKNFSVAMLDMDNFKGINEVFGHATGDIVLKRIAVTIQNTAKRYGAKGFRYGGEEFVITMKGYNAEKSEKIVKEIADSISNDELIQKYLPEFQKKANSDIDFLSSKIIQLDSVFPKLKNNLSSKDCKPLAEDIISLIETYFEKYNPADKKIFNEIIAKIKITPQEELPNLFHIYTKIDEQYTLGNELNKIYTHYNDIKNDLQKWSHHLNEHKMFTVSGGVVNSEDLNIFKDNGMLLVKVADEALKSAKETGKNTIVIANDNIIKSAMSKINKSE